MFRRYKKCYCMNNDYKNNCNMNDEILEDKCNHVNSYEDNYDSCSCGFDE